VSGTYLNENQFVQQYSPSHIGKGDAHHDDESADHKALTPCFEDELIGPGRLCHESLVEVDCLVVERYWRHDERLQGRYRETLELGIRQSSSMLIGALPDFNAHFDSPAR